MWHLLVIAAALYGLTAYDEYFPLVAREAGASTNAAALLVALTVRGQLAGNAFAGRLASLSPRGMSTIVTLSGGLIATGALAGHRLGFVAIAAGYGLMGARRSSPKPSCRTSSPARLGRP